MGKKISVSNTNLVFEELEPRLLLSADGLAVITESSVATLQNLVHSENEHTMIVQHHAEQTSTAVLSNTQNDHRTELVILDSRAPNFQQLHNDIIKAQQQGRDINVVILDAHRDGLDQISEALSKYNKLDAVHIVSHGSGGQLQLGATQLNNNTLKDRSSDISAWKEVFTDGGDLLIYGCNLADTQDGKSLVDSLSHLTATDVAASDDLTGNELLGGDWELEYTVGEVETQVAFSENMQQQWDGTLAAPSATADTYSVNEDQTLYIVNALTDNASATDLEALWLFNEGSGLTTADTTGNLNDGALINGTAWTTSSRTGNAALDFAGGVTNANEGDYVQTTADLSTATNFTLSAWFKTDTTTGQHHILWQGVTTQNGWGEPTPGDANNSEMNLTVGRYDANDKITFFMGYHDGSPNSIDITSASNFTDTSGWHHAVVVVQETTPGDPTELQADLYIDGVLEGSDTGTELDRTLWDSDLRIGRAGADQRYFEGEIDEVGIYNAALTDAEVRDLYTAGVLENDTDVGGNGTMVLDYTQPSNGTVVMNPDGSFVYNPDLNFNGTDSFTYFAGEISDGTTHYWNLDGTATDSVGGADGTIIGATTIAGSFGNALSFDDQAGDYVEVPDITYNDEFTISFKFQIDSNSGNAFQYLYSHDNPQDQNSINIYLTEDNWSDANSQNMLRTRVLDFNDGTDWLDIDISTYVNDGQWHEYTLTVSSTPGLREGVHVYLDGVHQNGVDRNDVAVTGISTNGGDPIDPGTNLFIGGRYDLDPNRFFDGAMQHIQIYNRALSDAEITDQHNNIARETVTITVNPVNDAPTGTDNTVSIVEDASYTFSAADFGFTDDDVPDSLKEVRIDSRDNISNPDRLQLSGANVTNGQIIPVAQLGNLVFTPQANSIGSPYVDFTFTVFDQADASDSTPRTMTINVTEANDPPTIIGTVTGQPVIDIATVAPFSAVTIDDIDKPNQTLSVIVTLDTTAKGVFTATSLLDSGFLDAGGGNYTYSGTAANATTAIQKLVYDPTDNRVTPGSTETITFTISVDDGIAAMVTDNNTTVVSTSINDTPTDLTLDNATVAENAAGAVIGNISVTDPDTGDTYSYGVSDARFEVVGGQLKLVDGQSLDFETEPTVNVTITVIDLAGTGLSYNEAFIITVTDANDAPTTAPVTLVAIAEDSGTRLITQAELLSNANDIDSDPLTATNLIISAGAGTLVDNSNGTWSYTPVLSDDTSVSFSYTVTDSALTAAGSATLDITPANDIPVAVNNTYTTNEDVAFTAILGVDDLLQNDSDLDGDTLTVNTTPVTNVTNGVLTLNVDGTFTYTPAANFNGSDSFTYEVSDGNGGTAQATVTITVNAANDIPVAVNDTYTTNEDVAFTAILGVDDLPQNDSDLDGDTLTVNTTPVTNVTNGVLTLNVDGTFTYTPAANFNGSDSFTYEVSDGNGGTAQATVTITVNAANDIPVAVNDTYTTNEDVAFTAILGVDDLLQNDSDLDGDTLTVNTTPVTNVTNGVLTLNVDGTFTYTPAANFNGSDSFTYEVSDGNGGTAQATVTITVNAANDIPVAVNDTYTTNEDVAFTAILGVDDLLQNDSDLDGDTLTVNTTPVTNVTNGVLTLNVDGTFTYTPAANFNGSDSFTYEVSDGNGGTAQATVMITVTAVNDPAIIGGVDTGGVTEDVDPDFDTLLETSGSLTIADPDTGENVFTPGPYGGIYGVITLNAAGDWDYVANNGQAVIQNLAAGATLIDTITVSSADGTTHDINITITGTNDAPVAGNDVAIVDEGASIIIDVAATDSDIDSALNLNSVSITTLPLFGTLNINGDGTVTYNHDGSENFSDSFSYTILDVAGAISNTATVTITVNPVNDPPVALGDTETVDEGNTVNINLAANDTDAENALDLNSIAIIGAPANGTLTVYANGTVDYTHDGSQTLSDTFSYVIFDLSGAISNTATVNITVNPVNNAPTTTGIADFTVVEDSAASSIDLNAAFDDSDNLDSELTYSLTGNTSIGLFSSTEINAVSGELVLDYAADTNGSSQISIRATDLSGASIDTLFTVTVTPVNDTPILVANAGITALGTDNTVISNTELRVSDIDNSDTVIVYTVTALPANGELIVNGTPVTINSSFTEADIINNNVSYQSDGTGASDQFSFTVSDGVGGTISNNTFNIDVQISAIDPDDTPGTIDPDVNVAPEPFVNPVTLPKIDNVLGDNSAAPVQGIDDLNIGGSTRYPTPPELTLDPVPPVISEQVDRDRFNFFDESLQTNQSAEINFSGSSTVADIQMKSIKALWIAIDEMKERIDDNITDDMTQVEFRAAAVSSSGVALTAGVVAWVLRSGALMTSLISTIPLWKGYDPLPILAYKDDDEEENIAEDKIPTSLEEMRKIKEIKERMKKHNQVDNLFGGSGIEG